jgi:DNA-binding transcriptional regulator LsrR (DeoR family)
MREIREVLRLRWLRLTQREIARSCSVGQSTVSEYLKAAEATGLRWADIAD